MIPGRCRGSWWALALNALSFVLLVVGTQLLARGSGESNPAAWAAPWGGDVILVMAGLVFLGLGFLMPLHAGVLNLGIYAQFLAGYCAATPIARLPELDPWVRAPLCLAAGVASGALTGALLIALRRRFALHEVLGGLLLGSALVPVARFLATLPGSVPALGFAVTHLSLPEEWSPTPGMGHGFVLTWGILLLVVGIGAALLFAYVLRASSIGFDLRMTGSNPLAASAAGVDVDRLQLSMLASGGAFAGLTGALQLWTQPTVALERWPIPLAFAGLTIALYGGGRIRGLILASILFAGWLNAPGTLVSLRLPGWGAVVALLLILPAFWNLARIAPDQGAPRALWRTRHREIY